MTTEFLYFHLNYIDSNSYLLRDIMSPVSYLTLTSFMQSTGKVLDYKKISLTCNVLYDFVCKYIPKKKISFQEQFSAIFSYTSAFAQSTYYFGPILTKF